MHVAVFGATGKIGRQAVAQLLDAEHSVTTLVRNPGKLTLTHSNLRVVAGELAETNKVRSAISGTDAVISALGPTLDRKAAGTPLAEGTRNIVAAMDTEGVRRFIGMATPSVVDPRDRPHWKHRVFPMMARLAFPNALLEIRAMTAVVTDSDLDWTIARITNPTDAPAKGTLRVGYLGRDQVAMAMSRADIAAFLIDQLTDTAHIGSAPAISN